MYKLGFIGCGNMANAIINGAIKNGFASPDQIIASARTQESLDAASTKFAINTTLDNSSACNAQIVVLAVKPQVLPGVLEEVKAAIPGDSLVISIAAGKSIAWLSEFLGGRERIVRFMPNTPAAIGQSMTSVCFSEGCTDADKLVAIEFANGFGKSEVISENIMDAASAVAGCSPAYIYMLIESMADAAVMDGMPRAMAYRMAAQAVAGSAMMVLESGKHPAQLKDEVCSPSGTTIQGLRVLEESGFRGAVIDALHATVEKAKRL